MTRFGGRPETNAVPGMMREIETLRTALAAAEKRAEEADDDIDRLWEASGWTKGGNLIEIVAGLRAEVERQQCERFDGIESGKAATAREEVLRAEVQRLRDEMSTKLSGTGIAPVLEEWRDDQLAEVAAKFGKGSAVYELKAALLESDRQRYGALRERNALRAALRKYGQHTRACDDKMVRDEANHKPASCTCGLDSALGGGEL